jgi:MinD-like ATPase involved in chromosome partitioning or flagellar assembly
MPPEAFRYMAFSMVTNNSKTMRTFMFTGIKTAMTTYSSAMQFAVAAAKGGSRVLLVDGDMLKSPISKALDAGGKPGMSDLLVAESSANVDQYITDTVHENLRLMPGGTEASMKFLTNAPQPKLEAIMQALRLAGDVIVFAVPPCDVLADASCLARLVDDVILVVSATQTNYRSVPLAQDLLQKAGAKNISLVMADAVADEEPFSRRSAYLARK